MALLNSDFDYYSYQSDEDEWVSRHVKFEDYEFYAYSDGDLDQDPLVVIAQAK